MDIKILEKANKINWEIGSLQNEVNSMQEILSKYEKFRSTVSFTSEKEETRLSLGSKKFLIKEDIKSILNKVLDSNLNKIRELQEQLNSL